LNFADGCLIAKIIDSACTSEYSLNTLLYLVQIMIVNLHNYALTTTISEARPQNFSFFEFKTEFQVHLKIAHNFCNNLLQKIEQKASNIYAVFIFMFISL